MNIACFVYMNRQWQMQHRIKKYLRLGIPLQSPITVGINYIQNNQGYLNWFQMRRNLATISQVSFIQIGKIMAVGFDDLKK